MPERALILIADDSEDDIMVIRKAFQKAFILNPLYAVKSGEEAIQYFKGEGHYSNRDEYPLPDLLLLDLKMPGIDGFEVLRWIRQQPTLSATRGGKGFDSTGNLREVKALFFRSQITF